MNQRPFWESSRLHDTPPPRLRFLGVVLAVLLLLAVLVYVSGLL